MNSTINPKPRKQKKCLCPCGELFTPKGMEKHISQSHYVRWLQETEAGKKEVAKKMEKAKRQVKRNLEKQKKDFIRKRKEEDKELKNKVTDWNKKLQGKVQEIVRLIDKGQPCLARGYTDCRFHGGHIISRGAGANIKMNLHNIHRQSAQSNHWQNDDALMKKGLEFEYGLNYLNFIEELRRCPVPKYTNEEYQMIYSLSCGIANRLKKAEKEYNLEERIELRNQINLELGIYSEEYCIFVN
jgi:hypothetical protein